MVRCDDICSCFCCCLCCYFIMYPIASYIYLKAKSVVFSEEMGPTEPTWLNTFLDKIYFWTFLNGLWIVTMYFFFFLGNIFIAYFGALNYDKALD